ncbi:MAG: hypothetical protein RRC07_12310 [Anaerolineae bacterium]|nr:hypothetical protein [Anaerolineae bacterium]
MTKFLNKWMRILHRWLAIPTIIIIPLAVITKFTAATILLARSEHPARAVFRQVVPRPLACRAPMPKVKK